MSMISELLDDLSSLQKKMQLMSIGSDVDVIERAKECIKMQSEKLQNQNLNGGWISCVDLEPDNAGNYLCTVLQSGHNVLVLFYDGEEWISLSTTEKCSKYVKAWMPLPEAWKGV